MTALTTASRIVDGRPILSSEKMLRKGYNSKCSVEKITDHESQVACRQDELIGAKPPIVK
jgi:hypothetical protein